MKSRLYECDGGTICIGTSEARTFFNNNYGDGVYNCTVDVNEGFLESPEWEYKGSVAGSKIYVYSYDCLTDDECKYDKGNVLFMLSGRFGVYANNGDILLKKWPD